MMLLVDCFALCALPASLVRLRNLSHLNLDYCDTLTEIPDLSELTELHVELLPVCTR